MLKETITYIDFNDQERTEDFYFNLTRTELIRMEMSKNGSLTGLLTKIVKANDMPDIFEAMEMLILKAYGEKSTDGRFFNKSEEISNNFMNSPAYDKLFEKLTTDATYAYKFLMGILPKDLAEQAKKNPEVLKLTAENGISVE